MRNKILGILCLWAFFSTTIFSQTATIVGAVTDEENESLIGVSIGVEGTGIGVTSDEAGRYSIAVPVNRQISLMYSYVGYKRVIKKLELRSGEAIRIDVVMESIDMEAVEIVDNISRSETGGLTISPKDIELYPSTTGSLEQVLQYLAPGVSAGPGGELTSQYSVRGGNYDENLVYVNGFEVYRPFLVRTGQQEGLSFPNARLIKGFTFSTGGFEAKYGDKMSSVLDIRYKRPSQLGASIEGSLLGASAHLEGAIIKKADKGLKLSNPQRFTWLAGVRYKTTRYLLNSLDLKGEYVPVHLDVQGDITYDISRRLQLELIGNYNSSDYRLLPQDLSTTTGLFNYALQLVADFEGGEQDRFETSMTGAALTWQPYKDLNMRLMASHYRAREEENQDIQTFYRLNQVETSLGDDNYGEVVGTLGYGETHDFIRNTLNAKVYNVAYTGSYETNADKLKRKSPDAPVRNIRHKHFVQWGARWQSEIIDDKLKEWQRQDSLGYTLPYQTGSLYFPYYIKTNINLNSNRLQAFLQDTWTVSSEKHEFRLAYGLRSSWWDLNNELTITPRVQMFYSPRFAADSTRRLKGITWKLSAGMYYQPPFYRELRNLAGEVNTGALSQKSVHVVGGVAMDFKWLNRPFKFIAEGYTKYMWDLIPFDFNNVQIRYYGDNKAKGYVTGLDLRLNGELVKDAESWVNLSFLRAREHFTDTLHLRRTIEDTSAHYVYDVPRPTDQFFILSMFFQDYLPKAKWASVHMALTVGSGLPFGVPKNNLVNRNGFRFSPYHRIDIGFSFNLWDREAWMAKKAKGIPTKEITHKLKYVKKVFFSVEVFNLMEVSNVASNTWVKDFYNLYYAIPNYLTSRRINARLVAEF